MPNISIDERLLGHILNDAFLSGSFNLQYNKLSRTLGYLNQYLAQPDMTFSADVLRLKNVCSQLAELVVSEDEPAVLAERIAAHIRALDHHDYLLMPGGWQIRGRAGHAMIYQFKYNAKGSLLFCIYNSGDGLEYHAKQSFSDYDRYNPILTYAIPSHKINDPYLVSFISLLIQLTRSNVTMSASQNAAYAYQSIFPKLAYLDGAISTDYSLMPTYHYTAGQRSGTSAQRALHQILKAGFASSDDYRRFIFGFKQYALDDYFNTLDRHIIINPQFQSQVTKAVRHALRLLNLKEQQHPENDLFSLEQKKRETEKLLGYLRTLQHLQKPHVIAQRLPRVDSEGCLELGVPRFKTIDFRAAPVAASMVERGRVGDKATLLEQMTWLESLNTTMQFNATLAHVMKLMQEVEHFFLHLPLPEHYNHALLPFYEDVASDSHTLLTTVGRLHALQDVYARCYTQCLSTSILPRKVLVEMSWTGVLHHLSYHHQGGHYFPPYNSSICLSDNIRLSMMDPEMDQRYLHLKALDATWIENRPSDEKIECYQSLLDDVAGTALKTEMEEEFERWSRENPEHPDAAYTWPHLASGIFLSLFSIFDYRSLYYLKVRVIDNNEHLTDPRYSQLIQKFKFQLHLEKWSNGYGGFLTREDTPTILETLFGKRKLYTRFGLFKGPAPLGSGYGDNDMWAAGISKYRLLNMDHGHLRFGDDCWGANIKDAIFINAGTDNERQINITSLEYRELFHVRRVRSDQILLTLDYFKRHLDKLSNVNHQVYLEANLFQPGLLLEQLKPEQAAYFWAQFDTFIQKGLAFYDREGELTQPSLFFIRMAYQVSLYAAKRDPQQFTHRLESFYRQVNALLEVNQNEMIRASLLPYGYLTLASGLLQLELSDVIYCALSAHIQTQLKQNPGEKLDRDTLFHRECAVHQFKQILAGHQNQITPMLIHRLLNDVGILSVDPVNVFYPYCTVTTRSEEHLTIDLERGLIFNQDGMACMKTPLFVKDHPLFKRMGLSVPSCCFGSMKNDLYQFEHAGEFFRLVLSDANYERYTSPPYFGSYRSTSGSYRSTYFHVQKKWAVHGETNWYQWAGLSVEQTQQFLPVTTVMVDEQTMNGAAQARSSISDSVAECMIPYALKERDCFAWVKEGGLEVLFTNASHQLAYRAYRTSPSMTEWIFETIDGTKRLSMNHPDILQQLASVEAPSFIAVFIEQATGQCIIELARYDLTFTARSLTSPIQLQREGRLYQLEDKAMPLGADVAHMVLKNDMETLCLMPIQRFMSSNERAEDNEYYRFVQDINAKIMHPSPSESWQYSHTEQYYIFKIKDDSPVPETPAQALYLCYVYLGSHQTHNAWKMLDMCHQHLGGLTGTYEELRHLQWIIHQLPYKQNNTQNAATLSNPDVVMCQLKALSLLTDFISMQDNVIIFPESKHAPDSPNGRYEKRCIQEIRDFYNHLNENIYQLYCKLQAMRRDGSVDFQLSDDNGLSLLQYYHQHLPVSQGGYCMKLMRLNWEHSPANKTEVIALNEILIFKMHERYEIGFCNQQGDYTQKRIDDSAVTQWLEQYQAGQVIENIEHQQQLNKLLLSLDARLKKPRALGALGYEWVRLHLNIFKKEWAALEARTNLTSYEVDRKRHLAEYIANHQGIAQKESRLAYVPIDLDISMYAWHPTTRPNDREVAYVSPSPDLSAEEFTQNFRHYLQIANNKAPTEEFKKLKVFCQQSLIAHRHGGNEQFFGGCNVLYHVCSAYFRVAIDDITVDYGFDENDPGDRHSHSWHDYSWTRQLRAAPPILVPQLQDMTEGLLIKTQALWDQMPAPRPSIKPSVERARIQVLSYHDELPEQLKHFLHAWTQHTRRFAQSESTDTAVNVGQRQYDTLIALKTLAKSIFSEHDNLDVLTHTTQVLIARLSDSQARLQDDILAFANQGPQDDLKRQEWQIDKASQKRLQLDIRSLLSLYFHDDVNRYQEVTGLAAFQIHDLHLRLSHYVTNGLILQQSLRVEEHIHARRRALSEETQAQTSFQLAQTLFAINHIDAIADPALSVFQYYGNLLIRPQQREAIHRLLNPSSTEAVYPEIIEKIIMGGGKSKVLLPALAQKKATGSNLVVIEVPRALLHTNFIDLRSTSAQFFNQTAYLFEFNRDSNCASMRLEEIFDNLTRVMVNRHYLVTTGDALQSLELKYLELLSTPNETQEWLNQVYWADKLVSLFRNRADLIIDEVHQGLWLKNKLNYTLGEAESVSPKLLKNCIELYGFLKHVPLSIAGENYSLDDVLKHNQLLTTQEEFKQACEAVADALVDSENSPLYDMIQRGKGEHPQMIEDLRHYLKGQGAVVPIHVLGAPEDIKNQLALYKEQVSRLLPYTLKRKHCEHYGASQSEHLSVDVRATAIPYLASTVPNERSRFGNYLEAINYTIQSQLISGAPKTLIHDYFKDMQIQAMHERAMKKLNSINDTDIGKAFEQLAHELHFKLSSLNLDDEATVDSLYQAFSHHEGIIHTLLETKILKHIRIDPTILHSDAINHVDLVHSCQGMSGTPWNHSTFHQRLSFSENASKGTDEYTFAGITAKNPAIHSLEFTDTPQYVQALLSSGAVRPNLRALIDICATFKGIDNLVVVREIAAFIQKAPERFAQPEPLQYILFFNACNTLCAWPVLGSQHQLAIEIGSSDPVDIRRRLNCTPDACFTYYDQAHTVGADIRQAEQAQALVMIDHETPLQSFLQGSMRMRGLLEGGQRVDLIVSPSLDGKNLNTLVELMRQNEQGQLQQDNYEAAVLKMIGLVRQDLMQRLLNIQGALASTAKAAFFKQVKTYFIEEKISGVFDQYGELNRQVDTRVLLEEHFQRIWADWKQLVPTHTPQEAVRMQDALLSIYRTACQDGVCAITQTSSGSALSTQVEVQKEIQKEVQKELQIEVHRPPQRIDVAMENYQPWAMTPEFTPGNQHALMFKSLTEVCQSRSAPFCPTFTPSIRASKNFYQTCRDQTEWINRYLKPVYALLFQNNPTLTCTLLSPQELEEIRGTLGADAWICTTQHTVLAGQPPVDIELDADYQLMVEQIRYFNAETSLLIENVNQLTWLKEDSENKMHFLNMHLSKGHEVSEGDISHLCELLSVNPQAIAVEEGIPFYHQKLAHLRLICDQYLTYASNLLEPTRDTMLAFPAEYPDNTGDQKYDVLARKYNLVMELYELTQPTDDPVTSVRAFRHKLGGAEAILNQHRDTILTRLFATLWGIIMAIPRAMFYSSPNGAFNHPFFWRSKGNELCETLTREITPSAG